MQILICITRVAWIWEEGASPTVPTGTAIAVIALSDCLAMAEYELGIWESATAPFLEHRFVGETSLIDVRYVADGSHRHRHFA